MHEFAAVRAAIAAIETAVAGVPGVQEVRLSIGPDSHLGGGRLEDLFTMLVEGGPLDGMSLVVGTDDSLAGAIRVDSIGVSRTESV